MYSGGQTQNVGTTVSQESPHAWCVPLLATDIGGPADSADGALDGWACKTPPALDTVKPIVCSNTLEEEKLSQCEDRLTDVYMINWTRSPENLRPVFEGFVELFVNSLFKTCSTPQSTPQSAGQCMLEAFAGGNILINLFGSDFALSDFIIKLADMLSGQPLPECTSSEIQAGNTGLTCILPAEEPCTHTATSSEQAVLMTMPDEQAQHAYMHERGICHDEPQQDGPICRPPNANEILNGVREPVCEPNLPPCPAPQSSAVLEAMPKEEYEHYLEQMQACHGQTGWTPPNPWESEQDGQVCRPPTPNEILNGATGPICQEQPPNQSEIGNPGSTQENHGCNPLLGAPCE